MDPPVVDSSRVCESGAGGPVKLNELPLNFSAGSGAVTMSGTFAVPGAPAVSDVKITWPL